MATLAAQFPHLKAYLSSAARSHDALNFEQLLGFLYAVSSAPDEVNAVEWMPFVFVDGLPRTEPGVDPSRVVGELVDLHNIIHRQVCDCRVELPQECAPRSSALANLDPDCGLSRWSQGFSVGHEWLEQAWDTHVASGADDELDWQLGGCMAVLCFFASPAVAEALHEEFESDACSLEDRASTMLALLPEALNAYADIGRCLAESAPGVGRRAAAAPPRAKQTEERCPCGSGRRFGLCCGAERCLH
jgi:uncharacterized protein